MRGRHKRSDMNWFAELNPAMHEIGVERNED